MKGTEAVGCAFIALMFVGGFILGLIVGWAS